MDEDASTQIQTENCELQSELCFVLPEVMTIETADSIASVFKEIPLMEKMVLVFDASLVENITTPGLQLIVSLQKTLAAQGGKLVLKNATQSFVHSCEDLGLQRVFG